jgi:hypothetical protein
MEKLEKYLDQICRSIGGPVEMREHVRQELREHLLDAIAQHKAAGMHEGEALEKALVEFGKPEEVRSELEETHGQRMIWIIDKTLQWKERTMKAKWLWVSWAYLGLAFIILLQALFITFNVIFIIPKFKKLMMDGVIDPTILDDAGARWMVNYLDDLSHVFGDHTLLWIVVPAVLWGLFEWRIKSENKPFMRLSALGMAAVALTVVVMLMAGSLVITFCLGVPAMARMARPYAIEQVREVDSHLKGFDAMAKSGKFKNEWDNRGFREELRVEMLAASTAMHRLASGPALASLTQRGDSQTVNELRTHLKTAQDSVLEAQKGLAAQDRKQFERELDNIRRSFAPIQLAVEKRPED